MATLTAWAKIYSAKKYFFTIARIGGAEGNFGCTIQEMHHSHYIQPYPEQQ